MTKPTHPRTGPRPARTGPHPTDPRTQAAAETPGGQLARQLYRLAAVRRELGRVAGHHLPGHGFAVLLVIRRHQNVRVSDIAADLQVDLSVASRQIGNLVRAGLVERRPDPDDGRAHVLEVTASGVAALREAFLYMVGAIDDALTEWTSDEVAQLATSLERLTTSFTAAAHRRDATPSATDQEAAT